MKTFRDLLIWQKALLLVNDIYTATKKFPNEEQFGLTSQIRRSCISIPSNIAEGFGRNTNKEFQRFLKIAIGSLFELKTNLKFLLI